MPIYEYMCNSCKKKFEFWLPMEKRGYYEKERCSICNGTLFRVTTTCSFTIKGSCAANGYSTDIGDIEKFTGRQWTNEDNKN